MFNITNEIMVRNGSPVTISVLSSGEAVMIVGALLLNNWCEESGGEGDGEVSWMHAKKQADEMVKQTIQNRLNLEADGVSVQWVTSAEVRG